MTSMLLGVWDYTSVRTGQTVRNVEGLCRAALNRVDLHDLSQADYEEALTHLVGQVIELERKYDPAKHPNFGAWLEAVLPWAHIDWRRDFYGRHGQKRPLDAEVVDEDEESAALVLAQITKHLPKVEGKVAVMLAVGLERAEIAEALGVSETKASAYIRRLQAEMRRLGLTPVAQKKPKQRRRKQEAIAA